MNDKPSRAPSKSIPDAAREFVEGVLEAVGEFLFPAPAPVLVPVRVRSRRR